MDCSIAEHINVLGEFCGQRDLNELSQTELKEKYGILQADVMVLFGGSILNGGDVFAQAIKKKVAKKYLIVGGEGHTTASLREQIQQEFPEIDTDGQPEALCFERYIEKKYGVQADALEIKSTNCGNNITYLLKLLEEQKIPCHTILLCQDATMQRRMGAVLEKEAPEMQIIHYAAYSAHVTEENGILIYEEKIHGMWEMERYLSLLLGEIKRLTDDEEGYGPKGAGFIVHVEIPERVKQSFWQLDQMYHEWIRKAEDRYASPNDEIKKTETEIGVER